MPHETKDSWITGYGRLPESGHHEDLRFYHATLLPNSEFSTKESREKYGLRSVHKNMFLKEEWEVLIDSDTMSPSEWVECNVFSYWVQTLHCGGYTRSSNWYEYFFGSGALEPGRTRIEFNDVGLGRKNDPFVAGDRCADYYVPMALMARGPMLPRHS